MKRKRNIQVIDAAINTTYSIFSTNTRTFRHLFPEGQDVEFADDLWARLGKKRARRLLADLWEHPVNKRHVRGIHGTLFYRLNEKKADYQTKREFEMVGSPWNPAQRRMIEEELARSRSRRK
jgi:hypothetical protein